MDVSRGARAVVRIAPLVLWLACASDSPGPVDLGGIDAGPREDGGPVTPRDAGTQKGPLVQITTPAASADPLTGAVLTGASVDVQCEARQRVGAAPVDPTKVSISVFGATGAEPILKVPATLRAPDTYGASVALNTVPTGRVRFRCAAVDSATLAPAEGWFDIETFYDAGPVITFTNLTESSVLVRGTNTDIDIVPQFKVEPARLAENDPGAEIADVKLTISEREVTLAPPVGTTYAKELDFYDFFANAPIESVTFEVTATNKRGQTPPVARKKLVVRVDGEGPKITFISPKASTGQELIVGGTVTVQVTITDNLAGVAEGDDKLYALIKTHTEERRYKLIPGDKDTYSFTFEASSFKNEADINPTIYASDKAGNKLDASQLMRLDTVPPWLSFDPPDVREVTAPPRKCSGVFDPLGDSPREGQVLAQHTAIRALVWERGIVVPGAEVIWVAGVRDGTVKLYAQNYGNAEFASATPLLIDVDKDERHECDSINSAPAGAPAPFPATLDPVSVGGQLPLGIGTLSQAPVSPVGCDPVEGAQPPPRCGEYGMSYVIGHTMAGAPPVVYAKMPTASGGGFTGTSFDLQGPGGWMCVVAVARDRSGVQGNLGISVPLRVCRKLSESDCQGAAPGTFLDPPDWLTCTDGCTLPTSSTELGMPQVLVR